MKLVVYIILFISTFSFSQSKLKREAFTLILPFPNDVIYTQKVPESPYFVYRNHLQIYPTETIFIEINHQKKDIVSLKYVAEIKCPEKTITINFNQETKKGKSNVMVLSIKNPLPYQLVFNSLLYNLESKKWNKTKVPPIKSGATDYAMWNIPIYSLILKDWRLTK